MANFHTAPGGGRLRVYIVLALSLATVSFSLVPGSGAFTLRKKSDDAAQQQEVERDPNDPVCQAQDLLSAKKYDQALLAYRALLLSRPLDPDVLMGLAAAYERTGDLSSAIKYATMATQAAPDSPQSHIALAKYLEQNRDQQQAFLQYSRAVDLRPPETTMQKIFSPMLRILMSVNDKDDALKLAKKWAKEYNKLADSQYNYAWILSQCDEKKLPEAVALYKQALQLDPNLTGAHYNMAILLVRLNQNEDAVAELKQFLKLAPDDADAAQAKKLLAKLTGGSGAESAKGIASGTPDKSANDSGSGDQAQQATATGDQAPAVGLEQAQTAKKEEQPQPAQPAADQSQTSEAAVPAGDKDQSTK